MNKKAVQAKSIKSLTPERKAFLKDKLDEAMKTEPRLVELRQLLLGIAGKEILAMPESHLEQVLTRGKQWPIKALVREYRETYWSDGTVARLWAENPDGLSIVTGYGLDLGNPVWKQHTWAWSISKKHIIETTLPFCKYFGVELNDKEASKFAFLNSEEDDDLKQLAAKR